jgi:hypothetical protein
MVATMGTVNFADRDCCTEPISLHSELLRVPAPRLYPIKLYSKHKVPPLRSLSLASAGMTGFGDYKEKGPALCRAFQLLEMLDQAADCSSVGACGDTLYVQASDGFHFLGIWKAEDDRSQG